MSGFILPPVDPACPFSAFSPQPSGFRSEVEAAAKWCAVYTTARHEKRIAQHFQVRGIEHFLPLYRVQRRWRDGTRATLDLPLFPSYIFVRIQRAERVRALAVPGALSIVGGTGKEPAALSDAEIDSLRAGLSERRIEPHPLLVAGQMGRIRSGALAGMQGVIVRLKSNYRVVITLQLIMQSIAVEVDADDVEALPES